MDVLGVRDDGYHEVATVMQQISLSDEIDMEWKEALTEENGGEPKLNIRLTTNRNYLPNDQRNLAYRAAILMKEKAEALGKQVSGDLKISITKTIPVAAGLAGGSGNGAAAIIGLNRLWELGLDTRELCSVGAELGSDVPFMVLCQNSRYTCALGEGRGEILTPVSRDLDMSFVLAKPKFGVSTKEVYSGIDEAGELDHPDKDALIEALMEGDREKALSNLGNVLEEYTLKAYPEVMKLKTLMAETEGVRLAMMSGSGPTVIGFCEDINSARKASDKFRKMGYSSFYAGNMRRNRGNR